MMPTNPNTNVSPAAIEPPTIPATTVIPANIIQAIGALTLSIIPSRKGEKCRWGSLLWLDVSLQNEGFCANNQGVARFGGLGNVLPLFIE
jgi:hypothetical protein